MTRLYKQERRTVWEPENYTMMKCGLVDFLASDSSRAVEGSVFLRKGTPEWVAHIDNKRKLLEARKDYPLSPEEVQKFIDGLSYSNFLYVGSTDFFGLSYERLMGPKRMLCDSEVRKVVCEVAYPHKRVEIFRGSRGTENLLGDQFQKASERVFYDGTLRDGLEEFREQGFTFILWDAVWDSYYLRSGERTSELPNITPVENVTIDDVFRFISQKQQY